MTEVSVDTDIDRLRREFEKLPIDQQLSQLRDGLWTMVNRFADKDTADPTDIIASVKHGVAGACSQVCKESLGELILAVEKIDGKELRRDIYSNMDVLLIAWGVKNSVGDVTSHLNQLERSIKTNSLRDSRSSVRKMRERRAQMRPLVEQANDELAHVQSEKPIKIIKAALMKSPDFLKLLPRDLKDLRYIDKDIAAIVEQINGEAKSGDD
jgi:hypothetical protein